MQKNKNNAAAARLPRSFCRSKTAKATHKTTERQSGRQSRPGLRSKLKKGLRSVGKLAFTSELQALFHTDCRASKRSQQTGSTGFLFLF